MKCATKHSLAWVLAAGLFCPLGANATNGMFMIGYGSKSVGMGGVAIGYAQDALAGASNPAAIFDVGNRADIDAVAFVPKATACLADTCVDSSANRFLIPNMGGVMQFTRKLAFGFSAVGAGGGGSRYNFNLYNNASGATDNNDDTMGVNLMIMQMNPTVAYKFNDNHTFGVSPVMSLQTFRAFGLSYFSNFTDTGFETNTLTNRGNDWSVGYGLRAGWLGTFLDERLRLGVTGTTRIYMSQFKKYQDLFAENGDIDTPANIGLGASFKFTDDFTVALDVQRVFYSEINSIGNLPPTTGPGSVFPNGDEKHRLGRDDGLGFGWEDQTVYKLGLAYNLNDAWTVRGGWNYGKSPIPEDNGAIVVNLVAPATTQHHATIGATYALNRSSEVTFAYMHAFAFKQYGPTYIGDTGSIEMSQNAVGVSYGLKF